MKILCLMPTYGRRKELLENSLACFVDQDYEDKHLIMFDDLGTLEKTICTVPNVSILSTKERANCVGTKFNYILNRQKDYDAVAVWDDDDVYLPNYLSEHVNSLEENPWSKPPMIWSAYFNPLQQEDASGRFHGTLGIHRDTLDALGGWIETRRATYDQEMIHLLHTHSPPGKTPATYVYRWQTSQAGHCSGLMGSEDWYEKYKPDSLEPIDELVPNYDNDTKRILKELSIMSDS